jgi:hypothetical protein
LNWAVMVLGGWFDEAAEVEVFVLMELAEGCSR